MMMPPVYMPAPPVAVRPAAWPAAASVPQPPVWAPRPTSVAATAQAPQPRPIIRMQAPEELLPARPPAPLVLPAPEKLGVTSAPPVLLDMPVDWNVTRDRLNHLGAIGFAVAKLPEGTYRIAFDLPTAQAGRAHHIEAQGATEGAAVCRALDLADQWAGQGSATR